VDWNKYHLAINQELGINRNRERKAIKLWKYDDFTNNWIYKVGDYGNRDAEFSTSNVAGFLASPSNQ
jgi:hypothetical protein